MEGKKSPNDYVGKHLKSDLSDIPVEVINKDTDEMVVYGYRFEPRDFEEGKAFHDGSALAYEIYVVCNPDRVIDQINQRIEQCQCGHGRSFAPSNAPVWLFPEGAMFDLEWEDVVPACQKRMLNLITAMIVD